jgi:integrase
MVTAKRARGSGSVYRPKTNGVTQNVWWIAYRVNGKRVRESANTTVKKQAETLLRARVGAVDRGTHGDPATLKTTIDDLEGLVSDDYEENKRRSGRNVTLAFAQLRRHLGGDTLAREVAAAAVARYKKARRAEGARNGTINRELAQLRRGMRLAVGLERLAYAPRFSLLREDRPRQGFLEPDQFLAIVRQLATDLQPLATFLYWTGWRSGEATSLQWRMVDIRAGVIRIEESKNDEARTIPYAALPALKEVIEVQRANTDSLERREGRIVPWVFHRSGKRIKAFLGAFKGAGKRAGVPGRLIHDMRRSAARNMIRAGIPQKAAMLIGGWKTASVFERYNIVDEKMIAENLTKLDALRGKA